MTLRDGMHERRRREWCDRGGRSSLFQRKMRPRSGMPAPQQYHAAVEASPPLPDPASRNPSCYALGHPFARSLTRQTARKAPSHLGCGKIECSWRCAPWHRSPSYDLRRAPYDHPDFTSNALNEDLFRASFMPDSGSSDGRCQPRRRITRGEVPVCRIIPCHGLPQDFRS